MFGDYTVPSSFAASGTLVLKFFKELFIQDSLKYYYFSTLCTICYFLALKESGRSITEASN